MVIVMKKLKELRKKSNFTYDFMAYLLDISKSYYWQIEHDQKRLSYDLAVKISSIFHLKPDDLFYDEFISKWESTFLFYKYYIFQLNT